MDKQPTINDMPTTVHILCPDCGADLDAGGHRNNCPSDEPIYTDCSECGTKDHGSAALGRGCPCACHDQVDEPAPDIRGEIVEIHGESGDSSTRYEVIAATTLEAARAWAADFRPAYRCAHDYDCCGHAYPRPAEVVDLGHQRFAVIQSWYRNV